MKITPDKPNYVIDFGQEAASPLAVMSLLARVSAEGTFHVDNQLRQPFGIYNISISRICDKLTRLCNRLDHLFRVANNLDVDLPGDSLAEIVDYIELSIYAAAEHVDDIDSMATHFFQNARERNKHAAYRSLDASIKQHKKFVSAAANAIKHQQSRIRLVSTDYVHGPKSGLLHGYFIEGVDNGVVCGSDLFHQFNGVLSATNLVWEIIVFVLQCSSELYKFLREVATEVSGPLRSQPDRFRELVKAAVKLPLYTFGEGHAFLKARLTLQIPDDERPALTSDLYGALDQGWLHFSPFQVGRSIASFEGDGVSKQFKLPRHRRFVLDRWS